MPQDHRRRCCCRSVPASFPLVGCRDQTQRSLDAGVHRHGHTEPWFDGRVPQEEGNPNGRRVRCRYHPARERPEDGRKLLREADRQWRLERLPRLATPDHWHAFIAVAAAKAGKDIYCEKPMAESIHEARAMVKAVRKNKRVFQTGSMQRSSKEFRTACELVRNARIGKITRVEVAVGGPGK
ncbi:MAG: hypothetical protein DME26_15175, partial [Verrucomicrobia bacterium]